MTTGEKIKAARKAAKPPMTQRDLASKLGLSFQTVSQWERGERNPKIETLGKIANALDTSPRDLCGDDMLSLYELSRTVEETSSLLSSFADTMQQAYAFAGFPKDLQAVKSIMLLSGYDLAVSAGEYYLVTQRGRYHLTEEQAAELLNSSVQYVEYLCVRLEKELQEISRHQRSDTSSTSPPHDYIDMLDKRDHEGQQKALERVEELMEIPKYQRTETPPAGAEKPTEDK